LPNASSIPVKEHETMKISCAIPAIGKDGLLKDGLLKDLRIRKKMSFGLLF
jgi:hypothetical protein